MIFDLKVFASRLKELVNDNNLTVRSLAEDVFLSPGTISKYLNANLEPRRQTIEVLAKYFKVNPAWLMGLDTEKYLTENEESIVKVPILGTIAAGTPIFAYENILGYENIDEKEGIDFCLKVKGTSMIGARIFDGDVVFIHKQSDVDDGEIAAVIIDGQEATLKRVFRKNGQLILHAENPTFPDMVFSAKDKKDIKILGKAKYVKFETK